VGVREESARTGRNQSSYSSGTTRDEHVCNDDIFSRVPEELHAQLTSLAGTKKVPAAEIIRELLKTGLQKIKRNSGHTLEKIARMGLKGPRNFSTQIDKFLYE